MKRGSFQRKYNLFKCVEWISLWTTHYVQVAYFKSKTFLVHLYIYIYPLCTQFLFLLRTTIHLQSPIISSIWLLRIVMIFLNFAIFNYWYIAQISMPSSWTNKYGSRGWYDDNCFPSNSSQFIDLFCKFIIIWPSSTSKMINRQVQKLGTESKLTWQ